MTSPLSFDAAQGRYEMEFDGSTVFAKVRRDGEILHIDYVEAPPELRGTGAAGTFMKALMDKVQEENLKVVPRCGYAATWISRHSEYKECLAP
jgi:predicted GNAT family acetyltransferase